LLKSPKVLYRVYKNRPPVPILSQINSVYTTKTITLRPAVMLPLHQGLQVHLRSCLFPSRLSHQNSTCVPQLLHPCYTPYPSNRFHHSNYTWRKSTSHTSKAPHYAVFSNLLSLHLSSVQISSSEPSSQTASVSVCSFTSETKFHTRTEPQAKL
jgi:hypothetical protein